MAVVNGVSIEFLKLLLIKGDITFPSTNSSTEWHSTFNYRPTSTKFMLKPRYAFIEALTRDYQQHAILLLEIIGLEVMLPPLPTKGSPDEQESEPRSNQPPSDGSNDGSSHSLKSSSTQSSKVDDSDFFFSSLSRALHYLVAKDKFELAMEVLKRLPKSYLNLYLLSSSAVRCLELSVLSSDGETVGKFLFELYLEALALFVRSRNPIPNSDFFEFEYCIFPRLVIIAQQHLKYKWTYDRFDLFNDLLTFILSALGPFTKFPLLHELCGRGYTHVVRFVLAGCEKVIFMSKDAIGYTPIYFAAIGGHVEIVEYLLERGATLDPQDYGLYHPLLGVLMYFNRVAIIYQKNHYRNCTRLEMDIHAFFPSSSCSCSRVFEDPILAQKLVNLVLLDPTQELVQPMQYLKALTSIHDLRPLAGLIALLPSLILSRLSVEDAKIKLQKKTMFISDYALYIARHFKAHPSPDLSQRFLATLVSFVSLSCPHLAAQLCYWKVVMVGLPCRAPRVIEDEVQFCRWGDIFAAAVRKEEKEVACHVVNELNVTTERIDELTLRQVTQALCKSSEDWSGLFEDVLKLPLSDGVILDGLMAAAKKGNFIALEMLSKHKESVLKDNLTTVLSTAAGAGQEEIVISLVTYEEYIQCPSGLEKDKIKLSFWVTVLEAAASHGQGEMALFAISNISQHDCLSLSSWSGFPNIINSCCWWGLCLVIESLSFEDSSVYLTDVNGSTPFESACGSGHYSTLVDLRGFPQLVSVAAIREISDRLYSNLNEKSRLSALLKVISIGWWQEVMKLSQSIADTREEDESLTDESVRTDVSISGFVPALKSNMQVVIEAFLNRWGRHAGVVMQALRECDGYDIVYCAVCSRSSALVETVLRALFDSDVTMEMVTVESLRQAVIQESLSILHCLKQFTDTQSLKLPQHGYNILHLLGLYSRSNKVYDVIISTVSDISLLTEKDSSGLTPCESALSVGNYLVAGKLILLMKKHGISVPSSVENESLEARGWFQRLMSLNEGQCLENKDILPVKGTSLRDAESLKNYFHTIKRVNPIVADVLLEASLGEFASDNTATKD